MSPLNTLAGLRAAETNYPPGATMPTLTQGWYTKIYLAVQEPYLVHDQLGMKTTLPKGNGEQVVWRRWNKLAVNAVPLSDGITPTGKSLAYDNVIGTVYWYGDWVAITDVVDFMHPDNVLTMATKRLAQQSAETKDVVTRDVINAGTSFLRVLSATAVGVGAVTTVAAAIQGPALDTSITMLEGVDAKYFHGKMAASTKVATEPIGPAFVCIIHPHVAHDLPAITGFLPREQYASGGVAYPSEVGKYRNVRFVTSTQAKVWPDSGAAGTSGPTAASVFRATSATDTAADRYSCLVLAKEAFGTIKLAGASATYYDPPGGNSDPLHRKATAGWKGCYGAAILQDDYMVRIECLAKW